MLRAIQSTVYIVMGQGLEMKVSHVFADGAQFTDELTADSLPYTIQDMDGKLKT